MVDKGQAQEVNVSQRPRGGASRGPVASGRARHTDPAVGLRSDRQSQGELVERDPLTASPRTILTVTLAGSAAGAGCGWQGREPEDKAGAVAGALGPNPPAVGVHDRPGDGQPDSAPAPVADPGRVDAEEALEHPL